MLIYGYKGDKCLNSDNCDDYSIKNIMSLYNKIEDYFIIVPYKRKKAYRFLFTNRMIY